MSPRPSRRITSLIPADVAFTTPGAFQSTDVTSVSQGPGPGDGGDHGAGPWHRSQQEAADLARARRPARAATTFRPGNGVTDPRVLREVKPAYTAEAMRAKVQGLVRWSASCCPTGLSAASLW